MVKRGRRAARLRAPTHAPGWRPMSGTVRSGLLPRDDARAVIATAYMEHDGPSGPTQISLHIDYNPTGRDRMQPNFLPALAGGFSAIS